METIVLLVSKKKHVKLVDELTSDPAFVVSLMKLKGLEKCPESLNIKIGIRKHKEEEEEDANT